MSSHLTALYDQAQMLGDQLYAQRDPVQRLVDATAIEKHLLSLIKKIRQESAYEARFTLTSGDIAEIIDVDRKHVDYLVNRYLEANPHKEKPPHHNRSKIEGYVDLTTQP